MSKTLKKENKVFERVCDSCIYDYYCTIVCRPIRKCQNYIKVEEGKTSEDYAKKK